MLKILMILERKLNQSNSFLIVKYKSKSNKSLSERLYQNYRVLKFTDLLSDLAVSKSIDIINRSSFSYIDSFKREK